MKKYVIHILRTTTLMLVSTLIMLMFGNGTALAASRYISVGDLPSQTDGGWHQTYSVHDNTVSIDIGEIIVPHVDQAPVVKISQYGPVEAPEWPGVKITGNEVGRFVADQDPNPLDSPSSKIGQHTTVVPLSALSAQNAYAEENALTFGEVKERAMKLVSQFGFDDCEFDYDHPYDLNWNQGYGLLVGRLQAENKEDSAGRYTGEPYGDKGFYLLAARQLLHGIPVWTDIRATFEAVRNEAVPNLGTMHVAMDSPDGGYGLCVKAAHEDEILCEDIPLCPFEKVKAAYEAEINQGHILQADQLVFAYLYFRDENRDFVCFPCWILRCQYTQNPKGFKDNSDFDWQDTEAATMLVVNAQTGELIDPYTTSKQRDLLPPFVTWEEVR